MRWATTDEENNTRETLVTPVKVHLNCSKCDYGEMISNGVAWPMYPAGYHHICNNCGEGIAIKGKQYPRIEYRDV